MFVRLTAPLRDEEQDAGGGVAVADPSATPQPDPSVPAEPAPSPEAEEGTAAPAEDAPEGGEGKPAPADEALPFDDDETFDAFIDLYGDKLLRHPKIAPAIDRRVQSTADRRLADLQSQPETHEAYQQQEQAEAAALQVFANELALVERGDLDLTDEQAVRGHLTRLAQANVGARAAVERRAQLADQIRADAVVQRFVQDYQIPLGQEHHAAYDEAVQMFYRLNNDPNPQARARALPTYMHRTLQLLADGLMAAGGSEREAQISKNLSARERLVRSNAVKEAAAKIAANRQPAPATDAQPKARPALNRETLLTGDWRQSQKVMREAGMNI